MKLYASEKTYNEIPSDLYSLDLELLLKVLDDATCHGFEFIVKDHKIFFTENVKM